MDTLVTAASTSVPLDEAHGEKLQLEEEPDNYYSQASSSNTGPSISTHTMDTLVTATSTSVPLDEAHGEKLQLEEEPDNYYSASSSNTNPSISTHTMDTLVAATSTSVPLDEAHGEKLQLASSNIDPSTELLQTITVPRCAEGGNTESTVIQVEKDENTSRQLLSAGQLV